LDLKRLVELTQEPDFHAPTVKRIFAERICGLLDLGLHQRRRPELSREDIDVALAELEEMERSSIVRYLSRTERALNALLKLVPLSREEIAEVNHLCSLRTILMSWGDAQVSGHDIQPALEHWWKTRPWRE